MFQKVISATGFWRSVITLAIGFIVIYNLIDVWFGYDFELSVFVEKRFSKDNLLRFFVANIMSGFVYGFVVTFLKFRGKIKKNESQ
jgi:NhaP-type Na+/H+ or K+/H+ antiporter